MFDSSFDELTSIEKLMYKCKFKEAFDRILNFEKNKKVPLNQQLSILILKGRILCYYEKYKEAVEVGELAYKLSQKLGNVPLTINSLLIKANIVFFGKLREANNYIEEAENLFNTLTNKSSSDIFRLQMELFLLKCTIYRITRKLNLALELALKWLNLNEEKGEKLDISRIYYQLGDIYLYKTEPDIALNYAMKSLNLQKELNNPIGIASSLNLVGLVYYTKFDFDNALKYCKQSLVIKEISIRTKIDVLHNLGAIFKENGELNRTLRYYNRAIKIAEKEDYIEYSLINIMGIGAIYRMKGDYDKALENFKRTLEVSKEINSINGVCTSLFYLIVVYIDIDIYDKAQFYLSKLEEFVNETGSNIFIQAHLIAKALILKKGGRIKDRTEAEILLKQITEKEIFPPQLYLVSFVNLCELFLDELSFTNKMDALDELVPLISRISKVAEKQNAYLWLPEVKLLQAKLALIQMKTDEAEQLLTHSQQIAEKYGLNLLAMKISSEHDNLLDQLKVWDEFEKKNAPLADRIKLASFKGVIDRMQGKSFIKPPKLTHETPVLLLIIGEGGFPLFSKPFTKEWVFSNDLFSGFLSAFDTFSREIFSKKLDRAKFGDYTIIMQPIGKFSICYLFMGQSYLAIQKLTRFVNHIQNTDQIWQTINFYYKTNRVIELKNHPSFESIINNIFISNLPKINT